MELYKQVIVLLLITKRQEQVVAQVNLSELSKAAGGTRSKGEEETEKQKSRRESRSYYCLLPEQVRIQLKMLAAKRGDTIENKVAEALNDLSPNTRNRKLPR
jgi:hypothetical protein